MKSKTLVVVTSLALLSAPAFAQSVSSQEPDSLRAAGKANEISKEIRSKIRQSLSEQALERIPKADFPIQVGEKLPENVKHHQLPVDIVEMAPQLRGFDYAWVGDEVVFLNPGTRVIVAILAV